MDVASLLDGSYVTGNLERTRFRRFADSLGGTGKGGRLSAAARARIQEEIVCFARGHTVRVLGPLDGPCSAEVIVRDATGLLLCGSAPRRDGWAAAV